MKLKELPKHTKPLIDETEAKKKKIYEPPIDSQDVDLEEETANESSGDEVVEVDVKVEGQESNLKMERERRSQVWNFFNRLPVGSDGRERAQCKRCPKKYICETKNGTGSLRKHIKQCPRRDKNDISHLIVSKSGSLQSTNFQSEIFRELLSEAIVKHDLPFMFVEYEGIRNIFQYLNENVITISRNTAKEDVMKLHKREKIKLKNTLEVFPSRISLTSDLWSSINTNGFICVTAHFIDEEWNLQKRILNFQWMPPPHNGVCLSEKISSLLTEWGIEKKLFAITLDNASSNDRFVSLLKGQLCSEGVLHSNGDYFHIRCCAHVLNLIVQDGMQAIDGAIVKVRDSVKYVKGSQARKQKFIDCVKLVNLIAKKGLRQDVPTRWNATYLMIESALFYRRAFCRLALSDSNFETCPTEDDWDKIQKIFKFLEVFYEVTCIFSGNQYPTANLYFSSIASIEIIFKKEQNSPDEFMMKMAENMYEKFFKYWSHYSLILAMAVVLDPRYKMQYMEFIYKKLYGSNASNEIKHVKDKMHALFGEYMIETPFPSCTSKDSLGKDTCRKKNDTMLSQSTRDMLEEFTVYESEEFLFSQKSQLDMYLDEPRSDIDQELNVLSFWKAHQYRYPELACMARDILSIPVSTVASESAFSNGGRVLDQYRSSLTHETVEALICTKDWLFSVKDDDELALHDLTEDVMKVDSKDTNR